MTAKGKPPGKLADELGVTGATLRNYVSHFGPFLSDQAKRKTRKRFSPEDVNTLKYAKSLLDDGLTYDQAADELETSQPLVGEVIDDEIPAPDPEPEIPPDDTQDQQYGLQLVEFLDMLNKEHKTALEAKDEVIAAKEDQISELRQDKERQQKRIDQLEQERSRSWWDRIRGK